jgi:UDP-N-acetylmuramate-alanine ligase
MFSSLKKVTVIGVGGGAAYYVAKVLSLLKISVDGYDQKENEHTKELVHLGANIRIQNPDSWSFPDSNLILYTTALPQRLQEQISLQIPIQKPTMSGLFTT